jgi:hypothetical protein
MKVKRANPGWSDDEIKEEEQRIKDDQTPAADTGFGSLLSSVVSGTPGLDTNEFAGTPGLGDSQAGA